MSTLCHRANQLLGKLSHGAAASAPEQLLQLVAEMLRLDRQAAAWRDAPEWAFQTLARSEVQGKAEDVVGMPEEVQLHRDLWMAYEWNYHRTARIILHQRLLACLDRISLTSLDDADAALAREAQTSSQLKIERLANEVLATVPQLLGDVDHLGRCRPEEGPAPRGQAIGAYFLLWPVKVVKSEEGRCTARQREAARWVFGRIRECTGMKTRLGGLSDI